MTDRDQDLRAAFIIPDRNRFGLTLCLLRRIFCVTARDKSRLTKQKAQRIQIMDRMVQQLQARLAGNPGPHIPGSMDAYLYLYIEQVTQLAIHEECLCGTNDRTPAKLLVHSDL